MGTTLVTPPTTDPVTLNEAKAHCRVAIPDDDGMLVTYLMAARQHIEKETRLALMTQTWDVTFDYEWPMQKIDGCQKHRIVLPRPPVQSVTSITYVDSAGSTQTLAASQYKVAKADTGETLIEPAYAAIWPVVRREIAAITVRFVAGYGSNQGDVPEPLRQAVLLLVAHWYENREAVNVGNISSELPFTVAALVFPYRVFY